MTETMHLLKIEFRRNVMLWFFVPAALLGWLVAAEHVPAGPPIWLHTSAAWALSITLLVPLMGGIAAWAAGRDRRRGMGDLLASTPASPISRDLLGWSSTTLWGLLAYLTAGVLLVITTGSIWAWGLPAGSLIVVGALAVVASAAIGYTVGTLIPSRFVPPLVAIVLFFALQFLAFGQDSQAFLSPVTFLIALRGEHSIFFGIRPNLALSLVFWLIGIAGVALALVAIWRKPSFRSVGAGTVMVVLTVTGATMLLGTDPSSSFFFGIDAYARAEVVPYEPVCVERSIPVCVHPAYQEALDDTADMVGRIVQPVIGIPGAPVRAEQIPQPLELHQHRVPDGTLPILVNPDREFVAAAAASALVFDVVAFGPPMHDDTVEARGAQIAIGRWLLRRSGADEQMLSPFGLVVVAPQSDASAVLASTVSAEIDAAVDRFAALRPDEQRTWLERNFTDLRAGRLTLEDLP